MTVTKTSVAAIEAAIIANEHVSPEDIETHFSQLSPRIIMIYRDVLKNHYGVDENVLNSRKLFVATSVGVSVKANKSVMLFPDDASDFRNNILNLLRRRISDGIYSNYLTMPLFQHLRSQIDSQINDWNLKKTDQFIAGYIQALSENKELILFQSDNVKILNVVTLLYFYYIDGIGYSIFCDCVRKLPESHIPLLRYLVETHPNPTGSFVWHHQVFLKDYLSNQPDSAFVEASRILEESQNDIFTAALQAFDLLVSRGGEDSAFSERFRVREGQNATDIMTK